MTNGSIFRPIIPHLSILSQLTSCLIRGHSVVRWTHVRFMSLLGVTADAGSVPHPFCLWRWCNASPVSWLNVDILQFIICTYWYVKDTLVENLFSTPNATVSIVYLKCAPYFLWPIAGQNNLAMSTLYKEWSNSDILLNIVQEKSRTEGLCRFAFTSL